MNYIQIQNFSAFIFEYNISGSKTDKKLKIYINIYFLTSDDLHIYESKYIRAGAHVENEIKSMAYIQHMLRMKAKSIDTGGIFFFVDSHENVECWLNNFFF